MTKMTHKLGIPSYRKSDNDRAARAFCECYKALTIFACFVLNLQIGFVSVLFLFSPFATVRFHTNPPAPAPARDVPLPPLPRSTQLPY